MAIKPGRDAALLHQCTHLHFQQLRLAFFNQQHMALVFDEVGNLIVVQRMNDVELQQLQA